MFTFKQYPTVTSDCKVFQSTSMKNYNAKDMMHKISATVSFSLSDLERSTFSHLAEGGNMMIMAYNNELDEAKRMYLPNDRVFKHSERTVSWLAESREPFQHNWYYLAIDAIITILIHY